MQYRLGLLLLHVVLLVVASSVAGAARSAQPFNINVLSEQLEHP